MKRSKKMSLKAAMLIALISIMTVFIMPFTAFAADGVANEEAIIKQDQEQSSSKPAKPNVDVVPDGMPSLKPNILVTGYSYDGSSVTGGQQFNFSFTLFNTSKTITVRNMVVKLKGGEEFALANGTDTIYIENLGYQESVTRNMNFTASMAAKTGGHPIVISLAYEYYADGVKADGTTELTVSVPVIQQDKLSVTNVAFSSKEMFQNEEYDLSYKVVNTGVTKILNATAHIVDSTGKELASAFVGTVEPGTEAKNTANNLSLSFPNLGEQTLLFKLTYENEKMQPQEVSQPLSANITEYVNKFADEKPADATDVVPEKAGMSPVVIVAIMAAILAALGITAGVIVHAKKKKRRMLEDEDI